MSASASGLPAGTERASLMIGVDFDNTIVSYDALMHAIATDWGLIGGEIRRSKRRIRDVVRSLPDGEVLWQRLQIAAYGIRMREAAPADGVREFFLLCRQRGVPVRIVSHKTTFPNLGESEVNLRSAAMAWLEQRGFLAADGFGVAREHVYFESSRAEKIARIGQLGITHFIDDLEETFNEPDFPPAVEKILYSNDPASLAGRVTTFGSWAQIQGYLLPATKPAVRAGRPLP
ncbi:MAG: hypothetical protein WA373_14885 [Burkholderiales bacterium]